MIDTLFEIIAPHHCYGCSKIGSILCDNCKYDIEFERFSQCIACGRPTPVISLCGECDEPYSRAWCVGERSGVLQRLIGSYKFQSVRAAAEPLAHLLADMIDDIPPDTVIVPVPTAPAHIRERGFDHVGLIAKRLGGYRKMAVSPLLDRKSNVKQRGAGRRARIKQASESFRLQGVINSGKPYLLVDDVITTGATLRYAAKTLRDGGATEVWAAVLARQSSTNR